MTRHKQCKRPIIWSLLIFNLLSSSFLFPLSFFLSLSSLPPERKVERWKWAKKKKLKGTLDEALGLAAGQTQEAIDQESLCAKYLLSLPLFCFEFVFLLFSSIILILFISLYKRKWNWKSVPSFPHHLSFSTFLQVSSTIRWYLTVSTD